MRNHDCDYLMYPIAQSFPGDPPAFGANGAELRFAASLLLRSMPGHSLGSILDARRPQLDFQNAWEHYRDTHADSRRAWYGRRVRNEQCAIAPRKETCEAQYYRFFLPLLPF